MTIGTFLLSRSVIYGNVRGVDRDCRRKSFASITEIKSKPVLASVYAGFVHRVNGIHENLFYLLLCLARIASTIARCGLFLISSYTSWRSVRVCGLVTLVSCVKTAEQIEMPFGRRKADVGSGNHVSHSASGLAYTTAWKLYNTLRRSVSVSSDLLHKGTTLLCRAGYTLDSVTHF